MSRPTTNPQVKVTIEDQSLKLPEHLYSLAYLARVYKIGSSDIEESYLTIELNDAYDFLGETLKEELYGDIAVYDIAFAATREPTLVKTLSSNRRRA